MTPEMEGPKGKALQAGGRTAELTLASQESDVHDNPNSKCYP